MIPINGISLLYWPFPAFGDFEFEGDKTLDLVIGEVYSILGYYKNNMRSVTNVKRP